MRYQKLGTIKKKKGLQLYEYSFNFNEGLLQNSITEVFVVKKPKQKSNQAINRH